MFPSHDRKVFIAIRSKAGNKLNATTKLNIKNDLLKYSMASIEPVITDPVEYFIIPKTWAYYDGNKTSKSDAELRTDLLRNIDKFNAANKPNRFGGRVEGSKYNNMIDNTDDSISGSVTQMTLGQNLDQFTFGTVFTQCIDFNNPIHNPGDLAGEQPDDGTGGS